MKKLTQKDLDKIPEVVADIKKSFKLLEKQLNIIDSLVCVLIRNKGVFLSCDFHIRYEQKSIIDKMKSYEKQLICPHNIEWVKWEYDGSDCHKDYYKCTCSNCGLEINSCSV